MSQTGLTIINKIILFFAKLLHEIVKNDCVKHCVKHFFNFDHSPKLI